MKEKKEKITPAALQKKKRCSKTLFLNNRERQHQHPPETVNHTYQLPRVP